MLCKHESGVQFPDCPYIQMEKAESEKIISEINFYGIFIISFLFIICGAFFNILVIGFNNGKMPAQVNFSVPYNYIAYHNDSEVNLPYLTDRIPLFNAWWSLGDLFMIWGFFIILIDCLFLKIIPSIKESIKNRKRNEFNG